MHRWLLAGVGVLLVGVAGLGVILPGLPTTIFLIGASWCFARSCPWLEDRLIRVPLFRPFLVYLDGDAPIPRRVVGWTLVVMWAAIAVSITLLAAAPEPKPMLATTVAALGLVGTAVLLWISRRRGMPESTSRDDRRPAP